MITGGGGIHIYFPSSFIKCGYVADKFDFPPLLNYNCTSYVSFHDISINNL